MKKVFFFLIVVAAAAAGVWWARSAFTKPTVTVATRPIKTKVRVRFGGTFDYVGGAAKEAIDTQMAVLEKLGIRTVRTIYYDCGNAIWFADDALLEAAKRHHIDVVFILEPRFDLKKPIKESNLPTAAVECGSHQIGNLKGSKVVDLEAFGYQYTKEIVSHYKDRVHYWQLLNEIGGTAMTGNADGRDPKQFDPVIYGRLKSFLRGATRAIAEVDPTAKTIVNNQWLHIGMLDLLAQDQIKFNIIGWNWFVDTSSMDKVEYAPGQYFNLLEALQQKKTALGAQEIWLSEFNRDHGSFNNNDALQAQYLTKTLPELLRKNVFSGIFIHELFDKPSEKLDQDRHWGIIAVQTEPLKFTLKPAANAVSDLISK